VFHPRRPRGVTLIEVLIVAGVSAILVGGAAAHFRSIRQVAELTNQRREAVQNARVVLDRLARQIRTGKLVEAISPPNQANGSITIVDFDDRRHVFALDRGEARYGLDQPTSLLAAGIRSLKLQGYDPEGEVPHTEPSRIDAVQITLAATIPGTDDPLELATRARLRRLAADGEIRDTISYATDYKKTLGAGLDKPERALGEPDKSAARLRKDSGGRYEGFEKGDLTGTVHRIFAGFRMRQYGGRLQITVRREGAVVFDHDYLLRSLLHVWGQWVWWWVDVTEARPNWTDKDIEKMSIEVRGIEDPQTNTQFDSFAIRAVFDECHTTFFWANRQGTGPYPNQWQQADSALGIPDGRCATGEWATQDTQSFRASVPYSGDEVLGVQIALNGYLVDNLTDDTLEHRTALPSESPPDGILGELLPQDLSPFVGPHRKETILIDVSNDRLWTWDILNTYEIRLRLRRDGAPDTTLKADAVGWRAVHATPGGRAITEWREQ